MQCVAEAREEIEDGNKTMRAPVRSGLLAIWKRRQGGKQQCCGSIPRSGPGAFCLECSASLLSLCRFSTATPTIQRHARLASYQLLAKFGNSLFYIYLYEICATRDLGIDNMTNNIRAYRYLVMHSSTHFLSLHFLHWCYPRQRPGCALDKAPVYCSLHFCLLWSF